MTVPGLLSDPGRTQLRAKADGATLLTGYVLLLYLVPSKLIFKPLGGAGTPAALLGLCAAAWWCWSRIHAAGPRHPMAWLPRLGIAFFAAVLCSYVAATSRVITGQELRGAQQGLVNVASWLGVLLLAAEGMGSKERVLVLLRRATLLGGCIAALGLFQFVTKKAWVDSLSIPGLTWNSTGLEIADRNGFARPAGTATHSIEFGLVMALLLPFAIGLALDRSWAGPVRRWAPVLSMCLAIPVAISRSAIIATVIVLAFVVPTWTPQVRRAAAGAGVALLVFVYLTVHGLLGTIQGLFTGLSKNASIGSRTDSYGLAYEFIPRSPFFGRGVGTFNSGYRILDNQYLALLIDGGIVAVTVLLSLFVCGIVTAVRARSLSTDPRVRNMAQAAAGAITAAAIGYGFFDGFAFPMFAGTSFLLLGLAAALATPDRVATAEMPDQLAALRAPDQVATAQPPDQVAAVAPRDHARAS